MITLADMMKSGRAAEGQEYLHSRTKNSVCRLAEISDGGVYLTHLRGDSPPINGSSYLKRLQHVSFHAMPAEYKDFILVNDRKNLM